MAGPGAVVRVRVLGNPRDRSRDEHDRAMTLMDMALREAGYCMKWRWDDRSHTYIVAGPVIPRRELHLARRLVCDRLGWPYELIEEEEG